MRLGFFCFGQSDLIALECSDGDMHLETVIQVSVESRPFVLKGLAHIRMTTISECVHKYMRRTGSIPTRPMIEFRDLFDFLTIGSCRPKTEPILMLFSTSHSQFREITGRSRRSFGRRVSRDEIQSLPQTPYHRVPEAL